MSRNGSGIYNLPTGNPVVTGTTITSNWANTTLSDISTALTGSLASDGQTPVTGDIQMGGNKVTGMGTPTSAQDATTKAYVDAGVAALGTMAIQNANNVAITGGTIDNTTVGASTANTVRGTTITATTQFSGPATGLTGTAASLTVGNATLSVNSTNALGYNQTWQDLTSSRSINTNYTNSTGKPIMVCVHFNVGTSGSLTVDSVIAGYGASTTNQAEGGLTTAVPNGGVYRYGGAAVLSWAELR